MASYVSSPKNIGLLITKLVQPIFKKRGFAAMNITTDWPYIIGEKWAETTIPEKLVFKPNQRQNGTLYLRVQGSAAVLLQHIEPEIIERVNAYFGYKAVASLKMMQGFHQISANQPKKNTPLMPEKREYIETLLKETDEGPLKEALMQLGMAIHKVSD
ncbi:MAG: DUF721 domain-containing protein [Alphaproteobacteria bacterium]|nr:DUF721 domain-containing protein [Alphaproteobacteria bacterium]